MDDQDLQSIVALLFALALLAVILIPFVAFIAFAFYQKSKRGRIVKEVLNEHQQIIGANRWFPVRYASELRFKALLKIFPWETAGVLVMFPGSVLFFGKTGSNQPLALQFAPGNSTVNWLGKAPWPNGAVSWFYFATAVEKHYFSSETGISIFGSHKTTRTIYEEADRSFQAHSPTR